MSTTTPKWITIYVWVVTAMTFMFSILAYVNPGMQFGGWEALDAAGALSLGGPMGLYIARNLATGVIGLFALLKKNSAMIQLYLVMRTATELMDLIHALSSGGGMQAAAFPLIMLVIDVFALMQTMKKEG
ncbi:MAG: hypothetical protein AAF388_24485 [Bacteroidota bacterium]